MVFKQHPVHNGPRLYLLWSSSKYASITPIQPRVNPLKKESPAVFDSPSGLTRIKLRCLYFCTISKLKLLLLISVSNLIP